MLDTFQQMTSKELWILISRKQVLNTQLIGQIHLQSRYLSTFETNSRISARIVNARAIFYGEIFIELNHTLMHASDILTASQ
jgi:hypothetical protein